MKHNNVMKTHESPSQLKNSLYLPMCFGLPFQRQGQLVPLSFNTTLHVF